MDFDCPTKPASYSLSTLAPDQAYSSSDEANEGDGSDEDGSFASSTESEEQLRWKPAKTIPMAYHNVYSNLTPDRSTNIKLPQAGRYRVEELPIAFSVETGVSYLSAQPCPVEAWVGGLPTSNRPLQTGVVDTGGPSIIAKCLVPLDYTILESPLKTIFGGIGNSKTLADGYVVLLVHLPNSAALSGDERSARIAKLWIEFQVVDDCPAGYLIGVDAIAAYKMSIDYPKLSITLNAFDPKIKIPISDDNKYTSQRIDPRIYAAEAVQIRPYSEIFVPMRYTQFDRRTNLLVTPVRHANIAEGTYASCSYAVMASDTSHLLMINPSPRPVKIAKEDIVGMYEPFTINTPFCYYGGTNSLAMPFMPGSTAPIPDVTLPGNVEQMRANPVRQTEGLATTIWTPPEAMLGDGKIGDDNIKITLGLDDPDLTWHDGIDVPIDPFGLENEFKESGPLQPRDDVTESTSEDEGVKDDGAKVEWEEEPPETLSRTEKDRGR